MKGFIGIDEVGRGPLAGPVTVSAVFINDEKYVIKNIFNGKIRDSKKLNKIKREEIFNQIKKLGDVKIIYVVSSRTALHIDKNGINNSINACIQSCLKSLGKKLNQKSIDIKKVPIQLDGGLKLDEEFKNQSTYIKGDEKFVSIALASIVAKVARDKYMKKLAKIYTGYDWHKNVGYGTLSHRKAIRLHGITKYHRKSYLKLKE